MKVWRNLKKIKLRDFEKLSVPMYIINFLFYLRNNFRFYALLRKNYIFDTEFYRNVARNLRKRCRNFWTIQQKFCMFSVTVMRTTFKNTDDSDQTLWDPEKFQKKYEIFWDLATFICTSYEAGDSWISLLEISMFYTLG